MSQRKPTAREVLLGTGQDGSTLEQKDARERLFFNQIRLANGTRKTTAVGRLPDVNNMCNEILEQLSGTVELLDIGISSGVTTLEWMQSLDRGDVQYHLDGIDICLDASIHSLSSGFHVLCDSTGVPLEFELFGIPVANNFGETPFHFIKRVAPVALLRLAYKIAKLLDFGRSKMQRVRLVTHRLVDSRKLRLLELDALRIDQLDKKYNLVRAANILNLEYFDSSFILDVVSKILSRLESGGFVCVARTHSDGSNHATVFRENRGGLVAICRVGDGSEIEALLAGFSV